MIQEGLKKGILVTWTKSFACPDGKGEDAVQLLEEAIARRGVSGSLKFDVISLSSAIGSKERMSPFGWKLRHTGLFLRPDRVTVYNDKSVKITEHFIMSSITFIYCSHNYGWLSLWSYVTVLQHIDIFVLEDLLLKLLFVCGLLPVLSFTVFWHSWSVAPYTIWIGLPSSSFSKNSVMGGMTTKPFISMF